MSFKKRSKNKKEVKMYVAKFDKHGIFWYAKLFQKEWSDEIFSNKIIFIDQKRFLFKILAKIWINKKLYDKLIQEKKLEIQNG